MMMTMMMIYIKVVQFNMRWKSMNYLIELLTYADISHDLLDYQCAMPRNSPS